MRGTSQAASRGSKPATSINPAFTKFLLRVGRSPIQGRGIFAQERIPGRRRVIEYTGEKISVKEGKRRLIQMWNAGGPRRVLIFQLNRRWSLDAAFGGSGAELINHSCAPNLETHKIHGHIYFYSRRTIRPGEELTVDYRFEADAIQVPCKCGAPTCRGTINLKQKVKKRAARQAQAGGHRVSAKTLWS